MEDAQENHFIRLTEVEPSPFEETTAPKSLPPQRSRSVLSTLGLGGCSWDYYREFCTLSPRSTANDSL